MYFLHPIWHIFYSICAFWHPISSDYFLQPISVIFVTQLSIFEHPICGVFAGAPTNEDTQPRKHWKNCGCPGTKTLVPFQVDNRFFVLISKMGFRNINLSFFPSVFMCSRHFLFLLEHCQHKWEYTIKKTPKKMGGHQSSGARAVDVSGSTWPVVSVARDGKDWWRGSLSGQFRSFLSVRTKFPKNLICKTWQQMFIKDWKARQNWP